MIRKIARIAFFQIIAITIILLVVFPVYWVIVTSLKTPYAGLITTEFHFLPKNIVLEAYHYAFSTPLLLWLKNSFLVCIPSLILLIILASHASYILSRCRFTGRKLIIISLLFVQLLPIMSALMPLFLMLSRLKLLNLYGLILVNVASLMPFHIINLKLFFDTIPREIEESAYLESATTFRIIYTIILPLAKPGLIVSLVLAFMGIWNEYILAKTIILNSEQYTLPVALGEISAYWQIPWPVFAVYSIIGSIPLFIVFIMAQPYLKKGLLTGMR